jgi:acyl carrier protein
VELDGLESLLRHHPRVRAAAITTATDSVGETQLIAFLEGRDGPVQAEELRSYLRTQVPDFMLPATFVVVEALPLKPNGKVDRAALAGFQRPALPDHGYEPPRTDIEHRLAEMWQEALGRDRVGVHDNFFDVGGHSLMATRLVSRIRQQFAVELPLQRMFESPTIAELAQAVEALVIADLERMTDDEARQWLDSAASPDP